MVLYLSVLVSLQFDGTPYFAMESGTSPKILLRQTVDYDGIIKSGKIPNFLIRVKVSVILVPRYINE